MPDIRPNWAARAALLPTGIRLKLLLAFVLMSAIPLTMLLLLAAWFALPSVRDFYQLERWFPLIAAPHEATWWLFWMLALTVLIAFLGGLYLAIKIIQPVIHLSHGATQLAKGESDRLLSSGLGGELDDLSGAFNQLTMRIRDNMSELKQFGERSSQINLEIHKRVIMFSGLLQIGELVSSGGELEVVLDLVVEKLALLEDRGFSFLCLQPLEDLPVTLRRANGIDVGILRSAIFDSVSTCIDAAHPASDTMRPTWEQLGRPNLLVQAVSVRRRVIGVLGAGNFDPNSQWSVEMVDLIAIFAKHATLAIENELLLRKTKALAIYDELTGVYNEPYMRERLAEEIKRAVLYQRPCAFAMFRIQDLGEFRQRHGDSEAERALKNITRAVRESVSEVDRVGRFTGNVIAVVLPECNKRQAADAVSQICARVKTAFAGSQDARDRLTLIGSVAENPVDGSTAEDLIRKASTGIQAS
ncbi:MAG: diguanylate cyclase [Candidatus Omnitrophica bacterium]|nr:diguanylate cyclase [Candidatus Omnitrophota bacterium]